MKPAYIKRKNIPDIKTLQGWLNCPPALSFWSRLVQEEKIRLGQMSVISLVPGGVESSWYGLPAPHLASSLDSQSSPSYSPEPLVAQADWIYHWRQVRYYRKVRYECKFEAHITSVLTLLRTPCRPSLSVRSLMAKALGRSCLLANTSKTASRSSSSPN